MVKKANQKDTEKQPKTEAQAADSSSDKKKQNETSAEEKENNTEEKDNEKQEEVKSEKKSKKKTTKKEKKKDPKDEKIQELGEQVEKLNDRYLRLQAEFDNYRKRTLKERAEMLKSAGEDVLLSLLTVVDDMDRAMDNVEKAEDIEAVKTGMKLIDQKFNDFIKQKGVTEIDALHQDFDTDLHEAVTKIPAPEEKLKGKIVDVIQKGYKLNDKVIRFAKVVIGE
ncbi:MAG: nucleotide exchange factor GrpE [Salinivirgaceae bacterium]|nr:MAG: nucleotide exchange factor GrpE [Salinivirgaceae bacterium]